MNYTNRFRINVSDLFKEQFLEIKNLVSKPKVPISFSHDYTEVPLGECIVSKTETKGEIELQLEFFEPNKEQMECETLKGLHVGFLDLGPTIKVIEREENIIRKAQLMSVSIIFNDKNNG